MARTGQPTKVGMPGAQQVATQAVLQGKVMRQVVETTLQSDEKPKPVDRSQRKYWIRRNNIHKSFLAEIYDTKPPDPVYFQQEFGDGEYLVIPVDDSGQEILEKTVRINIGDSTMNRNQIPQVYPQLPTILPPQPPAPSSNSGSSSDFLQMHIATKAAEEDRRIRDADERKAEVERRREEREAERKAEEARESKTR